MSVRLAFVVCVALGGLSIGVSSVAAASTVRNGSGDSEFSLSGISCPTSSDCMAVGSYAAQSGESVLFAEQWNGAAWSTTPVSAPEFSELSGVSCISPSDCMAVGSTRYGTLAEKWDGSVWSIVASPAPAGELDSDLTSVACASASSCTAVGYYANKKSVYLTLAAQWNGTKWTRVPTPDPAGVAGSELFGVSCSQSDICVAVGESFSSIGKSHTMAETWDGAAWALSSSANERPGQENVLSDVSCASSTDCTAVGSYFARSGSTYPLIEKWNGTSWTIVTAAAHEGALLGIDCSNSRACMAVGSSPSGTFTEAAHGSSWTVEKSPDPKGSGHTAVLVNVACSAVTSCDAVGFDTGGGSDTTYNLIESWNGHEWTISKSARP